MFLLFHLIGSFRALLALASAPFGILHSHLFLRGSLSEKMKGKTYNQKHLLIFLFIIFCLTKLTILKHIPPINDEAYTLTISRYFSLSYFDHPPLMMWVSYFLHLFEIVSLNTFRIPFIAFGLLTSFFIYKITSTIYSKQAGTVSAILYFVSPFFFFSGGLFIVPDASLNFSVAGATYIAIRLIFNNEDNIYLWISLGLLLSIAFLSKYQAYLFGITLFIAFIIWRRNVLFTKNFYISLLISLLGLVPVLLWNMENNFDSFNFHGNRSSFHFDLFHIFNSIFAQLFLLLPTTGFLIIVSLMKNKKFFTVDEKFLILLSLPTVIIFNILILFSDNSFSHWSMVGWMLLIPIASNHLLEMKSFKVHLIILKVASVFASIIMILTILIHAKTGFITRSFDQKIPRWDNTRELLDWQHIADILTKTLQQKELDSLATLNWYDSGQLTSAFYYKHLVGVIGPNGNHFKYIDVAKKNLITLIDIRLIHNNTDTDISEQILSYNYNIIKRLEIPFYRGLRKYGTISIILIEKIQ